MGPSTVVALLAVAAIDARVCLDERVPPEITRRLGGYLRTLQLHTRCAGEISRVRLTKSTLVLEAPNGTKRRRALPWRLDPKEPLRSVAQQGRLSELAVMIEALAIQPVSGLLPKRPKRKAPRRRRRTRISIPIEVVRAEPVLPAPVPLPQARPPMAPKSDAVLSLARSPNVERSRYEVGVQSWLR